ncbi:MAG: sigma-70 family RNA polymerase sigma factor [Bacteroidales bacterium]
MGDSLNNKDLVIAFKNRSVYAFEFLFKSNYKNLVLFANSFVMNRQIAEDMVQDSFTSLWEIAPSLSDETDLKKYLYVSVKNRCLNFFKHLEVVDSNNLKLAESIIHSNTLVYEDNQEVIKRVRECLEKLSGTQKYILEKRIFESRTYKEIADELNISELTVHTHIKRAYKYFRENFPIEFYFIFLFSNVPD